MTVQARDRKKTLPGWLVADLERRRSSVAVAIPGKAHKTPRAMVRQQLREENR